MIKFLAKNSFFVIFIVVLLLNLLLDKVFNIENMPIRVAISASIAVILSPRRKQVDTQTGKKTQITWFLLKEPIFLDK